MLSLLSSALGIKWGGLLVEWCSFCCGFCCPSSLTQELLSRLTPKCTQLSWHFPIGCRAKLFCVESIQQTAVGIGIAEKKNSKNTKETNSESNRNKRRKDSTAPNVQSCSEPSHQITWFAYGKKGNLKTTIRLRQPTTVFISRCVSWVIKMVVLRREGK